MGVQFQDSYILSVNVYYDFLSTVVIP